MSVKKYVLGAFSFLFLITSFNYVSAEIANSPVGQESRKGIGGATVPYCDGDECGFEQGIKAVENAGGFRTDISAVNLIQEIVGYLLTFVSLIAVLYIIFAGFQILTGNGEEEKLKKSKQTILYVILGIIVIWLAWPITIFVIGALNSSPV